MDLHAHFDRIISVLNHDLGARARHVEQLSMLMVEEAPDGEVAELARMTAGAGAELRAMIAGLRVYCRLHALPEGQLVDSGEVLTSAAAGFPTLSVRTDGALPVVWSEAGALRQVYDAILDNARRAGASEVVVAPLTDGIGMDLTDDGCGIPTASLERVFAPYMIVRDTGYENGAGLGLSCVNEIMACYRGSVRATRDVAARTTIRLTFGPDDH